MAATAAMIARVRRMSAEPTTTTYSDSDIKTTIETYPLVDERGEEPYTYTSDSPPEHDANEDWIPTYDLNAAAADIWEEKAGLLAGGYDFSADGARYDRSKAYEQAMRSARYYRSKRSLRTVAQRPEPSEPTGREWVVNWPNLPD